MDRRVSIFKQNKHAGKLNIVMAFMVIVYRYLVSISLLGVLFTFDLRWVFAGTWSSGWTSLCFC